MLTKKDGIGWGPWFNQEYWWRNNIRSPRRPPPYRENKKIQKKSQSDGIGSLLICKSKDRSSNSGCGGLHNSWQTKRAMHKRLEDTTKTDGDDWRSCFSQELRWGNNVRCGISIHNTEKKMKRRKKYRSGSISSALIGKYKVRSLNIGWGRLHNFWPKNMTLHKWIEDPTKLDGIDWELRFSQELWWRKNVRCGIGHHNTGNKMKRRKKCLSGVIGCALLCNSKLCCSNTAAPKLTSKQESYRGDRNRWVLTVLLGSAKKYENRMMYESDKKNEDSKEIPLVDQIRSRQAPRYT